MRDIDRMIRLLGEEELLEPQLKAVCELKEKIKREEVIISVIGQFKRGKSSLINAMLGEEILPVAIIPLTTVVTEIRYKEEFQAKVCFEDGTEKKIGKEELEDYCSEQKNPGNSKKVDLVRIWTPSQPFGEGIVLVDTPGVGSVHQHNTDSSYAYLRESDAAVFLLSVDSPVSETEREFLLKAGEYASRFFYVVNKADIVSEKDLNEFMDFCQQVISGSVGSGISMTAVSARTGKGIDELVRALKEELTGSQEFLIEESVSKKTELILAQVKAKLQMAIRTTSLSTRELEEKIENIIEQQKKLESFSEEVEVLAGHRTDLLVDRIRTDFDDRCVGLRKEMNVRAEELYGQLADLPTKEFEKKLQNGLDTFLETELNMLNEDGIEKLEEGYGNIVSLLEEKAVEAAVFLAKLLKDEFDLDYPVNESSFEVSDRSDFLMHLGRSGSLLLDIDELARLLPRKMANRRFYKNSLEQAEMDIEKNKNNMLYNYRYKMKESLRGLCRELSERIEEMSGELDTLIRHIRGNFDIAEQKKEQQQMHLRNLFNSVELL